MSWYRGMWDPAAGRDRIWRDSEAFEKVRTDLVNHADTFSWGYGGSGPAMTSVSILAEEYGDEVALAFYQDVKFSLIAGLGSSFEISLDTLDRHLAHAVLGKPGKWWSLPAGARNAVVDRLRPHWPPGWLESSFRSHLPERLKVLDEDLAGAEQFREALQRELRIPEDHPDPDAIADGWTTLREAILESRDLAEDLARLLTPENKGPETGGEA